jgi:hypothetical protein
MAQKSPDFLDRFADGLANAAMRMKVIENSPEYKAKRRLAHTQAMCIALIGLTFIVLAVMVCERFSWPRQIYSPIVLLIAWGGGRLLGTIVANNRKK